MKVKRECNTCKFNFDDICVGHGEVYDYGEKIVDDIKCCDDWGTNLKYFTEVTENAPWYIRNDYKINFDKLLKCIDDDENGIVLEVNLYDVIEKIYDLSLVELAEVLGISLGVINYAKY